MPRLHYSILFCPQLTILQFEFAMLSPIRVIWSHQWHILSNANNVLIRRVYKGTACKFCVQSEHPPYKCAYNTFEVSTADKSSRRQMPTFTKAVVLYVIWLRSDMARVTQPQINQQLLLFPSVFL